MDFRYQVLGEERGGGEKPRVIAGGGGSHMAKKVLLYPVPLLPPGPIRGC